MSGLFDTMFFRLNSALILAKRVLLGSYICRAVTLADGEKSIIDKSSVVNIM